MPAIYSDGGVAGKLSAVRRDTRKPQGARLGGSWASRAVDWLVAGVDFVLVAWAVEDEAATRAESDGR